MAKATYEDYKALNGQAKAGLSLVVAVAETVKDLGEVHSGTLYAALMDRMTLTQFDRVLDIMKRAGMVTQKDNLLRWSLGA
jgi:hypothetical protein